MMPLINILIRHTAGRDAQFKKCIESIRTQTFLNYKIIVCYDYNENHFCMGDFYFDFYVERNTSLGPFFYNDYCNNLMAHVREGWFIFLDDDDYLANRFVLEKLALAINDGCEAVVCQMSRDNGKVKPNDDCIFNQIVESGRIGLPCLAAHHTVIGLAKFEAVENGDYLWIKSIVEKVKTKFINEVIVHSPKRSFGK